MQNHTIVDRVVERLKAQPIGDLITEEDLHDIVKQAIPKTFFEPRVSRPDSYGRTTTQEPVIVEVMRDLLKDAARAAVKEWLDANAQMVVDYWKTVSDAGLMKYVQEVESEKATAALRPILRSAFQQLNNERERLGLPPLTIPY